MDRANIECENFQTLVARPAFPVRVGANAITRPFTARDFARKGVTPTADDAWSWSQWHGYLENADGAAVKQWFDGVGAKANHIHTSGHASSTDLREFAIAMKPKTMVPIHGVKWDEDRDGFPPITRLMDGEPLDI